MREIFPAPGHSPCSPHVEPEFRHLWRGAQELLADPRVRRESAEDPKKEIVAMDVLAISKRQED